jgi:hypothetical protein
LTVLKVEAGYPPLPLCGRCSWLGCCGSSPPSGNSDALDRVPLRIAAAHGFRPSPGRPPPCPCSAGSTKLGPLLNRKEEFIGRDDPRRDLYSKLTRAEVRAGLYDQPERIGSLQGWLNTLAQANVKLRGHRLVRNGERLSQLTPR